MITHFKSKDLSRNVHNHLKEKKMYSQPHKEDFMHNVYQTHTEWQWHSNELTKIKNNHIK